ncbi:MAG: universal stress protein [Hyphomicrobiales bacterium]|nr:universal stress protein [Hyphomicrobiales bacterium]
MNLQAFLPIVTYPQAPADASIANAVDAAALIGAGLRALAVNGDIPDVSNALSKYLLDTPQLIRDAEAQSRAQGDRLIALVKERAAAAGVAVSTGQVSAPIAALGDVAAVHARYHDIAIIPLEADNETDKLTAEAVVFGSGRPTLLLPGTLNARRFDHVAIAWDGSRVAARAVADARIFLDRCSLISVFTVYDEKPMKEDDEAERLATALRAVGLPAEPVALSVGDYPIGEVLQHAAIERDAGLLVMGGYGHSRLRDFVLGGATAGVLSELRLPVLLSH